MGDVSVRVKELEARVIQGLSSSLSRGAGLIAVLALVGSGSRTWDERRTELTSTRRCAGVVLERVPARQPSQPTQCSKE